MVIASFIKRSTLRIRTRMRCRSHWRDSLRRPGTFKALFNANTVARNQRQASLTWASRWMSPIESDRGLLRIESDRPPAAEAAAGQ